jgi:glucose-1-phosphate adenylyltransferase
MPAAFLGKDAHVEHSVVTQGCDVEGEVFNSVLSDSVVVEEGASVKYSVLMPDVVVERGAKVEYAILGENVHIGADAKVGGDPMAYNPDEWGIAVVGPGAAIAAGEVVLPKKMLNRKHEEVSR